MKNQLMLSALTLALSTSVTCNAVAKEVEVLHWWTSGSEATALNVLKDDLQTKGFEWKDMPVAGGGGEGAMTTLKARVTAGNPPSAGQLLGMAVQDWANEGWLGDISTVAEEQQWDKVIPSAVKEFALHDNKWVAVPVNIHRPNWLWINSEIFQKYDLIPPSTWEEFNKVASTLQAKGVTPLAHGGQPWQDVTIFDDVVLGIGGPDFYRSAIHDLDPNALKSSTMLQVFEQMRVIRGFVDDDFSGRDWNLATSMLMNGQAAMQLMGDWAKGEMTRAGVTPGKEILCVPAPSTSGSFLFISDFFAGFNVGPDKQAAQQALAASVLSKPFQEEFNLVKGSIPARTDISRANFDACGQKAMDDLAEAQKNGTLIGSLAHGTAQSASVQKAIFDVVTEHFNSDMSSSEAVELLSLSIQDAML